MCPCRFCGTMELVDIKAYLVMFLPGLTRGYKDCTKKMTSSFASVYAGLKHLYKNCPKTFYVDAKGILTKRTKKSEVLPVFE